MKRFLGLFLALVAIAIFASPKFSYAATRTWDGGGSTNNWSECANWSTDTCPVATDGVVFNGTSTKAATIDAAFGGQITTINLNAGYTGTVTLATPFTVTGAFSQAAGTMNLAGNSLSANAAFTLTGGSFVQNGGLLSFGGTATATLACNNTTFSSVAFAHTSGTKTVASNCTFPLGANPTLSSAGSLTVQGVLSGTGTLTKAAGTLTLAGATNLNGFNGLVASGPLVITGTLNAATYSTITANSTFTQTAGTFTAPALLELNGASSFTGGSFWHNNGTVAIGGVPSSTLTCSGTMFHLVTFVHTSNVKTIGAGCTLPLGNDPVLSSAGSITVQGTLAGTGTLTKTTGTLTLAGGSALNGFTQLVTAGTLTVAGTFNASGLTAITANSAFNLTGGTFTAPPTLELNGPTVTMSGGTFVHNNGLVVFGGTTATTITCTGAVFNLVTFVHPTGTKTVGSTCTLPLGHNPSLSAGGTIAVQGTLAGSGTLTRTGGGLTLSGVSSLSGFTELNTASLNIAGTVDTSNLAKITVNNTLAQTAGTFTAPAILELNGPLNITGGTFVHNNGTIVIGGSTTAILTCKNAVFNLVVLTPTANTKTIGSTCTLPLGTDPVLSSGGNLNVQGILSGTGTLTKTSGVLTLAGTTNLSGFTNLVMAGDLTITGTLNATSMAAITANGPFILSSGSFRAPTLLRLNSSVNIIGGSFVHNSGTVEIGGTSTVTINCNNVAFSRVVFTNTGTGTKTTSANCNLPLGANPVTATGTVINNGTMSASGVLTFNGIFQNGGTFNFSGTTIHAKRNFNQLGTFNMTGKTLMFDGLSSRLKCNGVLGGTVVVNLTEGSFVNHKDCTMSLGANPNVVVGDHFTNNGALTVASGTLTVTAHGIDVSPLASLNTYGLNLVGDQKWRDGVVGTDGKIYTFPQNATDMLIIDPATKTAIRSAMGAGFAGTQQYYGGVLASTNGKIYAAPYDAPGVLIVDTDLGTATIDDFGLDMSDAQKWIRAIEAPNGKLYGVPVSAADILIIDPLAGTAMRSNMGADLSGTTKWRDACLGADGKIYGMPYDSTDILIIDPVANTATRSAMGAPLTDMGTKYSGCVTGNDGKIYGIPQQADQILIIDPLAGTASLSTMGADLSGTQKWAGGVLGPDGKIYGTPFDSGDFLIIDPVTSTATRNNLGVSMSDRWIGMVLGPDNQLYAVPSTATEVVTLDFTAGSTFTNAGTLTTSGSAWNLSDVSFRNLATGTVTAPATITLGGDWYNDGAFTHASGTVTLTGLDQNLGGQTTFYNLSKAVSTTDTLTFAAGKTQTITHALTLTGASSLARLALESSVAGVRAQLNPQAGVTVQYLDVQDNENLAATIVCPSGCVDGGNNQHWTFIP